MSDKITENQKIMFRLLERSPDIGGGWRQVSDALWRHAKDQAHPELTELDTENKRIRFTPGGLTIVRYTI